MIVLLAILMAFLCGVLTSASVMALAAMVRNTGQQAAEE